MSPSEAPDSPGLVQLVTVRLHQIYRSLRHAKRAAWLSVDSEDRWNIQ